jgi:hypothetical protein
MKMSEEPVIQTVKVIPEILDDFCSWNIFCGAARESDEPLEPLRTEKEIIFNQICLIQSYLYKTV